MPHRISEIEAVLTARPDVSEAVVIDYGAGGPVLVLAKPEIVCSGPELRDLCAARLGEDAGRAVAVLVSDLPSGGDGYPDLQAVLGGPYVYRYEPPVTGTEKALVALWNEVLGRDHTGVLDDFLDLGGDSVLAVRLINAVADELGVTVDIVEFFEAPSVRAMAALADSARLHG